MNKLTQLISGVRARRRADPYRKAREEAKCLAAARGFVIERTDFGILVVWPPSDLPCGADPYEGNRHCYTWDEVLVRAKAYATAARV